MDIHIRHLTTYAYEGSANHSIQLLRMTPLPHRGQHIIRWQVTGAGRRDLPQTEDAFGNIVHTLSVTRPHKEVVILIEGHIQTEDTGGVLADAPDPMPHAVFLRDTPLTAPDEPVQAMARELEAAGDAATLDGCHRLLMHVHEAIVYTPGTTSVTTCAADAITQGQGVCQDHAHVMLAVARQLGIPARYVSGYLETASGGILHEASHAWAELFVPDLGWVGFDAANGVCPDERYVRMATGLDYLDAAPITGIRRGGGMGNMSVDVEVGTQQVQMNQEEQGAGEAPA